MSDNQQQSTSGVTKALVSGAVLIAVGAGVYAVAKPSKTPDATNQVATPNVNDTAKVPAPVAPKADKFVYADGEYTQEGTYVSPGGPESIGVTLTIEDDLIVDASVEAKATLPASLNWQNTFASGLKSQVVGKKLDDVRLEKVSGSSLTPVGFNEAVTKIKADAKL
jgi:hypothetical protein